MIKPCKLYIIYSAQCAKTKTEENNEKKTDDDCRSCYAGGNADRLWQLWRANAGQQFGWISNNCTATNTNDAKKTENAATDEGDLGDYHVKILDAETGLKDYDGNPVIGVKYEYTNNGEENMMFDVAVNAQAFQDGVQLELAFMDEFSDEYENSSKEVKPGTTLTCEMYYALTSDSEVEVEVSELISFGDAKLTKTFSVAQ